MTQRAIRLSQIIYARRWAAAQAGGCSVPEHPPACAHHEFPNVREA